jgi:hypothetical protein
VAGEVALVDALRAIDAVNGLGWAAGWVAIGAGGAAWGAKEVGKGGAGVHQCVWAA